MDGMLCCTIFFCSLYNMSSHFRENLLVFLHNPEGRNVGTVGRTGRRREEEEERRGRDRPFTICGSVSKTCREAFCRAICRSL